MDFYISFPDKPVYLECSNIKRCEKDTETGLLSLSEFFTNKHEIILFPDTSSSTSDRMSNYLKSSIKSQKLLRAITSKFSSCHTTLMCGYCQKNDNGRLPYQVYRGVCAYFSKSDDTLCSLDLINLASEHNFKTYFCLGNSDDGRCNVEERNLTSKETISDRRYKALSKWENPVNPGNEEQQSMIFTFPDLCPVYHGYSEIKEILHKCSDMPKVIELLEIADKHIPPNFNVTQLQKQIKHPFVVVEGLDATGKTTLTETLEKKLNAARYYTPPPEVNHLRQFFDALPEIIRRAYYCIGNYIVAVQIAKECQNKAVIMDRFWHSTTAYGVANESSTSDLPHKGHWVYHWPSDLIKPTLVLFLSVTEEVRKQRIMGRGGEKTFEEKHLDKDILFRQRLCEAYRRMENPACVEIDASGSKESVVQAAIAELDKQGIKL